MKGFVRFLTKLPRVLSLILVVAAVWLSTGGQLRPKGAPPTDIQSVPLERIVYLFPGATSVERKELPTQASEVLDSNGTLLGYVVATAPYSDSFIGYGGQIPMLVALDTDMKVKGIQVLANSETPSFLDGLREGSDENGGKGLFDVWNGLGPDEAAKQEVAAVSGATLSSNAIIHGVQTRLAMLGSSEAVAAGFPWKDALAWGLGLILVLLALASFFWPGRMKKARVYLLAANVVVLGFWMGSLLSLSLFDNWVHNGVAWWVSPVVAGIGLLGLLLPLFTDKSFYCIYVCPFGSAQELVGLANKKKWVPKRRLARVLRTGPKVFLGVVASLLVLGVTFDLADVEPFSAFLFSSASVYALVLAGVFLALSVFVSRPWCKYLCPTGEILEVIRRPDVVNTAANAESGSKGKGESMKAKDIIILVLALLLLVVVAKPQVESWVGQEVKTQGALAVLEDSERIQNFTGEAVPRDVVDRIVKAGLRAHSAKNKRPCDVWVTQERARIDKLAESFEEEEKEFLRNASATLIVVGLPSKGAGGESGFWVQDCSAATQALLYSASAQGVGGVWLGVYPNEELTAKVAEVLELPDMAKPVALIPVGVPLKLGEAREGVDLNKVHWNVW